MEDAPVDLRNHGRRLAILAAAVVLGLTTTTLAMSGIGRIARAPSGDPMSQTSVWLLAISIFVVSAALHAKLVTALEARSRARAIAGGHSSTPRST